MTIQTVLCNVAKVAPNRYKSNLIGNFLLMNPADYSLVEKLQKKKKWKKERKKEKKIQQYPDKTTMADIVLLVLATCYISQDWVGVVFPLAMVVLALGR